MIHSPVFRLVPNPVRIGTRLQSRNLTRVGFLRTMEVVPPIRLKANVGHCVQACGQTNQRQAIKGRNSTPRLITSA